MLLLGVLAAQAEAAAPGPTPVADVYDLLETEILTGSQTSVTFTSLNSTYGADYQHLQIRAVSRTDQLGSARAIAMRINGDSGNNYAWHILDGDGSIVTSSAGSSTNVLYSAGQTQGSNSDANAFGAGVIDFLDAFETTKNKTVRALGGSIGGLTQRSRLYSGFRNNTEAITSITLYPENLSASFVTGSRFSLYGLKAA